MTLQASQLAYARGNRKLFSGVSFELGAGEAMRVAGRNGSGKTSLLRVLCGLAEPADGEVRWNGLSVHGHRDAFHQALTYIGHGQGLKDDLSALENVQMSALLSGRACTRVQALHALERVGLRGRSELPARVLSQGQRRRVALARLALAPTSSATGSLLVLDEPFVALDLESVSVLTDLLNERLALGAALIYTTHQTQHLNAKRVQELVLDAPQADAIQGLEAV
ncbi:MAG: cytochrome c biogenesis heme-transporting ATPase CcmA [Aquabacterium sp.]|uniref:cytochrome c biogenesis heme-transporting ATPase CcmA n=1 Tax=Aquabacterium sp. TaxID=1872578 RepID=UPI001200112B|nr:cytochrome c biogenesis heme-transporting ATPase CcmA [Aquabacterium sp.]TAK90326.1 MAG: cytochrome c biogenesis heme-transporting ATPase CcmA [Aquabacterium sp.]